MARFRCAIEIEADQQAVFDLARDIDAHIRTQAKANERAIAGVTSGLIGLNESVTWRATHFRIPFRMTSRIVSFDSPNSFVDEQTSGPFKRFRHVHTFEQTETGTRMIDDIDFTAPLGKIGTIVDRFFLGSYIEQLIQKRGLELKAEAETDGPTATTSTTEFDAS